MKLAALQFNPVFGEKQKNLDQIEAMLLNIQADLIVLPELCTTGYQFSSKDELLQLSESIPGGGTIHRFSQLCQKHQTHIVAGLSEKSQDVFYNSAVLIGPRGYIGTYRKIHLFLNEKDRFAPGNTGFPVWDIGPARIGMMVCFDWIFPEAARTLALKGADIICHPSNLVLPYCQNAMITRSIENKIFSVTANRIGSEQRRDYQALTFTGGSQAVNPSGERLFQLSRNRTETGVAKIDTADARDKKLTLKNHLFEDRRSQFYYKEDHGQ